MIHTPPRRPVQANGLRRVLSVVCLSLAVVILAGTLVVAALRAGIGPAGEYAEDPALRQSWLDFIVTDVLPPLVPALIVALLLAVGGWMLHRSRERTERPRRRDR